MAVPKSKTTIRISTNMGTASQYAGSPLTVIELRGRTPQEKGEHYLQLSLGALQELSTLLKDNRLSGSEKVAYSKVYDSSQARYDAMVKLRDQLLTQKKSLKRFLVNLFVRNSESSRFLETTYWNYSTIRRTSDELHRRLLPSSDAILASGCLNESDVFVREESPREEIEGDVLIEDLPPNRTLEGISLDVYSKEEEKEVFAILDQIGTLAGEDDEDDDSATVRPSSARSRSSSPSPSCTVIYHINNISNSLLSINSEVTGAAITLARSGESG